MMTNPDSSSPRAPVFLTGATSHTGSHLLRIMLGRGMTVKCLIRSPEKIPLLPKGDYEIVPGDAMRPETFVSALTGCRAMLNIAHIRLAAHFVEACRQAQVRRIVSISSTRRYTKFPDIISQRVIDGENAIRESDLDYTIIRASMIYGSARDNNMHNLLMRLRRWPVFPLPGGGKTHIQPVFVEDLCQALLAALERDATRGKEYNICGPEPLALREAIEILIRQDRLKTRLLPAPTAPALFLAQIIDALRRAGPAGLAPKIRRLQEDKTYDISDAQRDLGFNPRSFEDGVRRKLEWLAQSNKF
ncbi:NAD(P)H-binding protein [Candidatus Sumerlaeota bacterium]|nr:NAD(P)H-binding protein [Candidatus Sumerlaeota bacterium]